MPAPENTRVYEIEETFRAPLAFAFRWCTDYTPADGRLSKEGNGRQILSRKGRKIVYEDLYPSKQGWMWSRQTVTLHPPDRWTARAEGNYRIWDLVYTLRPLPDGSTRFRMRGARTPVGLGRRNPSQKEMQAELHRMWRNYGKALAADYRKAAGAPRA